MRFTDAEVAEAIAEFTAQTPAREVPAIGKNSSVLVYGENANPYKPIIVKEDENESSEAVSGPDIGIELEGLDGLGDSPSL